MHQCQHIHEKGCGSSKSSLVQVSFRVQTQVGHGETSMDGVWGVLNKLYGNPDLIANKLKFQLKTIKPKISSPEFSPGLLQVRCSGRQGQASEKQIVWTSPTEQLWYWEEDLGFWGEENYQYLTCSLIHYKYRATYELKESGGSAGGKLVFSPPSWRGTRTRCSGKSTGYAKKKSKQASIKTEKVRAAFVEIRFGYIEVTFEVIFWSIYIIETSLAGIATLRDTNWLS